MIYLEIVMANPRCLAYEDSDDGEKVALYGLTPLVYIHTRGGLWIVQSWLQGRKHNLRIAKLAFHAKESPIRTRDEVLSLVSSRFNSPDDVHRRLSGYPLIQDSLSDHGRQHMLPQ